MANVAAKIIGGMFGLETALANNTARPRFNQQESMRFVNATSALAFLITHLRPRTLWLPSYLCDSLVNAARWSDCKIRYYPISFNLEVQCMQWLDELETRDLVLEIDYFGFPTRPELLEAAHDRGALVVEDATQALFIKHGGTRADFALFSPRKFVGVPDGGILVCNKPLDREEINLTRAPLEWWLTAFNASNLRRQFDESGINNDWFKLFQASERGSPVGLFRMSELSERLLADCFDYAYIAEVRARNYDRLLHGLEDIALFPKRAADVTPLSFPIRVPHRNRIRQRLVEDRIYPPVHWDLRGFVPEHFVESHRLSGTILSIPCDQRYDDNDMTRIIVTLRAAIHNNSI